MKRLISVLAAVTTLTAVFPTPLLAKTIAPGEGDYWRKPDIDYSVFEEDKPLNDKGLFEVDKKTGKQTQFSKDFQKAAKIYQQARPVIDLVSGIFGIGKHFKFLDHIDKNLQYGEWLFGKVPREEQERGTEVNGVPIGDIYGVDGKVDPTKARETALSSIEANAEVKVDSPFGVSRTQYKMLVGDLAVTRAKRKELEIMFSEAGQRFAKEARDYAGNVVKASGQMVDQAIEAKSTQDVEKINAQIAANGQILDQVQFVEQQQTRFSVDRGVDAQLTQLEIQQQQKWDKELDEAKQHAGVAQVRQLAYSQLFTKSPSTTSASSSNTQVTAQQNPSFIRK
jgi:hypothetical protein